MSNTYHVEGAKGVRERLQSIEDWSTVIRKKLLLLQQGNYQGGEVLDDAVILAENIAKLASHGKLATAAEAIEIEAQIEQFITLLSIEIDSFTYI
ncbi:MAG: hypothetical protein R3C11_18390 [Planctomycetaceae bacterium]